MNDIYLNIAITIRYDILDLEKLTPNFHFYLKHKVLYNCSGCIIHVCPCTKWGKNINFKVKGLKE